MSAADQLQEHGGSNPPAPGGATGLGLSFTPQQSITFIFAFLILLASILLNSLLIVTMRRDQRLHIITYYYMSSVCAAMLIQSIINFPPTVLYQIIGQHAFLDTLCILWIYLDTFLCNVLFLHALGSSVDTYLRLRYPARYTHSTSRGSTCLKLGAPWSVSFIQTTSEFAVSRRYSGLFKSGVCLQDDPNFMILRSVMSVGLPVLVSMVMLCMSFHRLRDLRNPDPETVSALVRSYQCMLEEENSEACTLLYDDGLPNVLEMTEPGTLCRDTTTDTFVQLDGGGRTPSREVSAGFELCRMTPIPELVDEACPQHGHLKLKNGGGGGGGTLPKKRVTTFRPDLHLDVETEEVTEEVPACTCTDAGSHQTLGSYLTGGPVDQNNSNCALLMRPAEQPPHGILRNHNRNPEQQRLTPATESQFEDSWRRMFRLERKAVLLNLCTLLICLLTWAPYMTATLARSLCVTGNLATANAAPTTRHVADLKWLAYSSSVAFAAAYLVVDGHLRRSAALALLCKSPEYNSHM